MTNFRPHGAANGRTGARQWPGSAEAQRHSDDAPLGVVSLEEQVLARLRRAILAGTLPIGRRLTIREVADEYGVSRTPVRTAVKQLESEGLVAVSPRSHIEILGLRRNDLIDVNRIRSVLEGLAVRLSTQNALERSQRRDDTWLKGVEDSLERLEASDKANDLDAFVVHHNEFHLMLDSGNANDRLFRQILQLYDYIAFFRKIVFAMPDKREESMQQHREILEAVKAGDAHMAEMLTKEHIEGLDKYITDLADVPSQSDTV